MWLGDFLRQSEDNSENEMTRVTSSRQPVRKFTGGAINILSLELTKCYCFNFIITYLKSLKTQPSSKDGKNGSIRRMVKIKTRQQQYYQFIQPFSPTIQQTATPVERIYHQPIDVLNRFSNGIINHRR